MRRSIYALSLFLAVVETARGEFEPPPLDDEHASRKIRIECFGHVSEHSRAVRIPVPFWKKHRLFRVTHFTFPHVPDCAVALGPGNEVLPLAARGDRIASKDPLGSFNRIAAAENLRISERNVLSYLRLFLGCHFASFRPGRLFATEKAARSATRRELTDAAARREGKVPLEAMKGTFHLRVFYVEGRGRVLRLFVRIRHDGRVAVETKRLS